MAGLRDRAGNRPDLLAQPPGPALSRWDSTLQGDRYRLQADLCIKARADVSRIAE